MNLATRLLMMGASGSGSAPTYVEDVFSTWLYTGNGSTQTITNGIDLSGKGGLVWIKYRSGSLSGIQHNLYDTSRGTNKFIDSGATHGNITTTDTLTAFNSSGFTLGADVTYGTVNYNSSQNYASWTFRKAAKFFDVVTYTGTGSAQAISHNLGSAPGFIVAKRTNGTSDWIVYHQSRGATKVLTLNSTGAEFTAGHWDNTTPTSTQFYVGGGGVSNNLSGGTYVAYLFAHDAGGFGDSGNDNVISCGSFVHTNGTVPSISLGYEPQWVLIKNATGAGSWLLFDNMRGMPVGSSDPEMYANSSAAESNTTDWISPNATGFTLPYFNALTNNTFIYIAIRRGPMKTPTDATKVFDVKTHSSADPVTVTSNIIVDTYMGTEPVTNGARFFDRIRGGDKVLTLYSTGAEFSSSNDIEFSTQTGFVDDFWFEQYGGSRTITNYLFRRAPGFFDVVAYVGVGNNNKSVSHNLKVAPELMFIKSRSGSYSWRVYIGLQDYYLELNSNSASVYSSNIWANNTAGANQFILGPTGPFNNQPAISVNASGVDFIAYLFASCPGVSKVGSYTGTGTTLNVDCGFTNGARFVLIKRTDSTGDWFVWDTARGIVSGNESYTPINLTSGYVTNTDYIDPLSSGFQISSTAPAAINANGGSFIFLAVA